MSAEAKEEMDWRPILLLVAGPIPGDKEPRRIRSAAHGVFRKENRIVDFLRGYTTLN